MPGAVARSVIRISGPESLAVVAELADLPAPPAKAGLFEGLICFAEGLKFASYVYIFPAPRSYTGQDLAEIHTYLPRPALELFLERIFQRIRQALPGEFTFRAWQNGRLDLTQAEAVAHIVSASNQAQLDAARKLFEGRLGRSVEHLEGQMTELLGLIEAGLDFSDQDIEFISQEQAGARIDAIIGSLTSLLETSVRCEYFIELPSVGLAGAPNAGKSSLLNALTAMQRSIVSDSCGTTRDVLRQILTLPYGDCVLFDCAGLGADDCGDMLESLARQAGQQALGSAEVVLLCVDISRADWTCESALLDIVGRDRLLAVAAKADLLGCDQITERIERLKSLFGLDFMPVSAKTGYGLAELKNAINTRLLQVGAPAGQADDALALNQRHRGKITDAVESLVQAGALITGGQNEVAAMFVRSAIRQLTQLQAEDLSEKVLEDIFSRFCIGK